MFNVLFFTVGICSTNVKINTFPQPAANKKQTANINVSLSHLRALWVRISLLAALGHLKSSEWSGWRALEMRLQPRTRAMIQPGRDQPQQDSLLCGASSTETRVLIGPDGVTESNQPGLRYRWGSQTVFLLLLSWPGVLNIQKSRWWMCNNFKGPVCLNMSWR